MKPSYKKDTSFPLFRAKGPLMWLDEWNPIPSNREKCPASIFAENIPKMIEDASRRLRELINPFSKNQLWDTPPQAERDEKESDTCTDVEKVICRYILTKSERLLAKRRKPTILS